MSRLDMTVVTVFRSRLRPGVEGTYSEVAAEMSRLVRLTDGFIDERHYDSADGERVTISRFSDLEHQRVWATNPDHLVAQRRGKEEFYAWYDISVAEEVRSHVFDRDGT